MSYRSDVQDSDPPVYDVDDGTEDYDAEYQLEDGTVKVHVVSSGVPFQRDIAPEYGSWNTYTIPVQGTQDVTQLLQRRPHRTKAFIYVQPLTGGAILVINTNRNAVTGATPQGGTFAAAPAPIEHDSQQPLYATALIAPVTVVVCDQAFGGNPNA